MSSLGAIISCQVILCGSWEMPGKGNDKGKVEGLVGYARRNFMVPIPHAANNPC